MTALGLILALCCAAVAFREPLGCAVVAVAAAPILALLVLRGLLRLW